MNNAILQDKVFKFYTKRPHCIVCRKRHMKNVRSRFNYSNLSDISIFAANCIGGELYYLLGLKFSSPLINISIDRNQFITLCSNLKEYLSQPISVSLHNGMCVGKIGGGSGLKEVEIRFPHDTDCESVKKKWAERCKRVNYEKIVLINDDKGLTVSDYEAYKAIPAFRKILFTAKDMSGEYEFCHQLVEYDGQTYTGSYNGKSLDGLWKFTKMWDYVSFLNGDTH